MESKSGLKVLQDQRLPQYFYSQKASISSKDIAKDGEFVMLRGNLMQFTGQDQMRQVNQSMENID